MVYVTRLHGIHNLIFVFSVAFSVSLYDAALQLATTDTKVELMVNLTRRLGNAKNELGVFYMNKAAAMMDRGAEPSFQERELWKKSFSNFESGIRTFDITDDRLVISVLYKVIKSFERVHIITASLAWNEDFWLNLLFVLISREFKATPLVQLPFLI